MTRSCRAVFSVTARLQNGLRYNWLWLHFTWRLLYGKKGLMQYFLIITALLEIQCLHNNGFLFSFLILWMRLILKVIGSYKHTVYYVMQIGAITLASML